MKVATRLAIGTGLLCAVLAIALAYHVSQLRRLVAVNRNLAAVTFRAATVSLELVRRVDRLDEYMRKLFVTGDPAYAARAVEARESVAAGVRELTVLALSPEEEAAVADLRTAWRRLPWANATAEELTRTARTLRAPDRLESLTARIELLRVQVEATLAASQRAIAGQVIDSAQAGEDATRISLVVVVAAVLLGAVVVTLTVRSITVPLESLTRATRAVAQGSFSTQLPVRGSDEFGRLAEDFNTMVHRLGELDALKRDFVSHVSHELKTPLVAMQETTKLMLEGAPGPLEGKQRRLLELNLEAGRRLSRMIANLLDLSRLEAGTMQYEVRPWPLASLVEVAAGELEALASDRGVRLAVELADGAARAACDRDRIVQVIQNLIDNAIRHSPEGATVRITAGRLEGPAQGPGVTPAVVGGQAVVRVTDEGAGVPEADRERVFERFRQLSAGRRGSVGLGLAICRQIVTAHGGAIWVEDGAAGGSVFAFTLPLASGQGAA